MDNKKKEAVVFPSALHLLGALSEISQKDPSLSVAEVLISGCVVLDEWMPVEAANYSLANGEAVMRRYKAYKDAMSKLDQKINKLKGES